MKKFLFFILLINSLYFASISSATTISIPSSPEPVSFFIPLQSSTSGNYSDGYGQTADTLTLSASGLSGDQSSGWLDLSLAFSPIPNGTISNADLFVTFYDLDLLPYNVASVLFFETAELKSGGTTISILDESYAISNSISPTNNAQIDLMFNLVPITFASLPEPFILDITLRAELKNNGDSSIRLRNTRESMLAATIDVTVVPEPATMILLGSGLVGLGIFRKKFKK